MESQAKFHWCLHVVIRAYFKVLFPDIFQDVFSYTIRYYFALVVNASVIFNGFYTFLCFDYDIVTGLHAFVVAMGAMEVLNLISNMSYPNC